MFKTDTFSFGTQIGQITNATSSCIGVMANFPKDSEEYKLLSNRVRMGCAAQSRQIDKTKIGEAVKTVGTIWKQYQRYSPDDTEEDRKRKDFYNSILVDKKPYFFRYKYNTLNKEYNEYIRKSKEDCEIRFYRSLDSLLKEEIENPDNLTSEEKEFLRLYRKYLPVVDSPCVMNKICKYIENVDFHIKQKVRSSQEFDYRILVTDNFAPNKALYSQICEEVFDTFTAWERDRKTEKRSIAKIGDDIEKKKGFDKEVQYALLKQRLENICSNEESLTNHLVYLFYVDKPSYNKAVLWKIVGKQIYETMKNKVSSYYFPQKNPNGTLEFLYEKYSIERIIIPKEEEPID